MIKYMVSKSAFEMVAPFPRATARNQRFTPDQSKIERVRVLKNSKWRKENA